jgi:hypothetical protein
VQRKFARLKHSHGKAPLALLLVAGLMVLACAGIGNVTSAVGSAATAAAAISSQASGAPTPESPAGQTPAGPTPLAGVTATPNGATGTGTSQVEANLSGSGHADMPRLAFDAQGTLHLVWLDTKARDTGDVLHLQKAASGEWSKSESLTADFETIYGDISLIRDQGGNICAIFSAARSNSDPATIGLYERCQAGATWSPAVKLAITKQTGLTLRGYSPALGADGTVHAAYVISVGTVYFDDVQLSTDDATAGGPSLVIDKAGGYHVTWVNLGTANSAATVQYRFSPDQGKTWQAAQILSTDKNAPSGGTTLVADATGDVRLLWGDSDIYYRLWTPAGGWGAPAALAGEQTGPNPTLAMDAQGLARVVWENRNGLPYVIQAPSGAWSAPRAISNLESVEPQIIIDAAGASRVAWVANKDVYYLIAP